MTNSKHTPTPWVIDPSWDIGYIKDGEFLTVCEVTHQGFHDDLTEASANAEFIARACNGWDSIEALRERIAELEAAQ